MSHRSGFVGLLGRPSVGKSTLLNRLVGRKVAITSRRAQTTRNVLRGILTRPEGQIVFVDTPGLHVPHHRLGELMIKAAEGAAADVDVLLLVIDASKPLGPGDELAFAAAARVKAPAVLVANKVDLAADRGEAAVAEALRRGEFAGGCRVSAVTGQGVEELVARVFALLPEGPAFYPPEMVTDQEERFLVAETIREKALEVLREEVPHALAVDVELLREEEGKDLVHVAATLYVEKESQKGIVIGRGGQMLKAIGSAARYDLERHFGRQVHLELWVKVREDWRNSLRDLREFGYEE
ncbi:MAG TPA: GTPase Era [Firmicutes bacterium]|nr:GTPase Era [Bacillota bacterium]